MVFQVKESDVRRPPAANDELQTFSLDYEKHVQEKIEEHKRTKSPPPV